MWQYKMEYESCLVHKGKKKKKKKKKTRTKQEQKIISLVTPVAQSKSEGQFQNTQSATTENENLKMCYALLVSLQESMKKYCGIP